MKGVGVEKFTDKWLQALIPKEGDYREREGHGFTVRVMPSGLKRFEYIYLWRGKRKILHLGNYPQTTLKDARTKFNEAAVRLAKGYDPAEALSLDPGTLTIKKLAEAYLEHSKAHKSPKTHIGESDSITRLVVPMLDQYLAREVRRPDAIRLIESVAKTNGGGMAAQVLKHARCLMQYALERDLIDFNPFSAVGRAVPAAKSKARDRALSDMEIKQLWHALTSIPDPRSHDTRRALLLILVTGQRPGEVCGMHNDREVKTGEGKKLCASCKRCGWWTIPWQRIKTRSRREKDHRIYLSPLSIQIIGDNSGYIFKGPRDQSKPLLEQALSHFARDHKSFGLTDWTPNDLRRSCATGLSRLGCTDEIIDAILNHVKKGVIGTYNQNEYLIEKQYWLTLWSSHLVDIVS